MIFTPVERWRVRRNSPKRALFKPTRGGGEASHQQELQLHGRDLNQTSYTCVELLSLSLLFGHQRVLLYFLTTSRFNHDSKQSHISERWFAGVRDRDNAGDL
jgi:hypothetical protein